MGFSFKTKRRWAHNTPVDCKAQLNFTKTQSGRAQAQLTFTDHDGNKQYSWVSLESEKAEGILSAHLRPFINAVCGTTMTPETIIERNDLLQNLAMKDEDGKTLKELLENRTIPMSIVTKVVEERGQTRVRVVSLLSRSERNGGERFKFSAAIPAAKEETASETEVVTEDDVADSF